MDAEVRNTTEQKQGLWINSVAQAGRLTIVHTTRSIVSLK